METLLGGGDGRGRWLLLKEDTGELGAAAAVSWVLLLPISDLLYD